MADILSLKGEKIESHTSPKAETKRAAEKEAANKSFKPKSAKESKGMIIIQLPCDTPLEGKKLGSAIQLLFESGSLHQLIESLDKTLGNK